ncbi:Receptor L-domain domain-containing protein [Caenorhabditis elegans]|uniref:Receptor L-domain domain-containing protein n=1 Tax=Caenorhabditis elegans TaxID=6239 RepID=B3CJ45_CAEEL|nr:Receptor L-domain domain-containing protein [Caenorhabditis elegans]CCD72787.2 Receptor L-domain domain-containing protein [Caenorhabditis elegans]
MFLLLVLFCQFLSNSADFNKDLKELKAQNLCDNKCIFNHFELTSETIDFFPKKCETVCGFLMINSNSNLTEEKLKVAFKDMSELVGGLTIDNSSLESLSFFKLNKITKAFHLVCLDNHGVSLVNNSKLSNINILTDFYFLSINLKECLFHVADNKILDATTLCERGEILQLVGLEVFGNLKDCRCRGDLITTDNIQEYQNCTVLNGGLRLSNFTSVDQLTALSEVTFIKGDVEISWNGFKDLSFLGKLKTIAGRNEDGRVLANIHDNYAMTRFGWEKLGMLYDSNFIRYSMNIENLHPDFCLTIAEMLVFLAMSTINFENIQAKYCEDEDGGLFQKFCTFQNLSTLDENCNAIFGDVVFGENDGRYMSKFFGVGFIFGSVTVQNTKTEGLKFLDNLSHVASLDATLPAISITSNQYLKSAKLNNLMSVIAESKKEVVLRDNSMLINGNKQCNYKINDNTGTDIKVEIQDCEAKRKSGFGIEFVLLLLISHIVFL